VHDPEQWEPVFPRVKREAFAPEVMLLEKDAIMIRFSLIEIMIA
jgi:hypothetical protein